MSSKYLEKLSSLKDIILDFDLEMRRLEEGKETTRGLLIRNLERMQIFEFSIKYIFKLSIH